MRLDARVDPHDVHALIASPANLQPGAYRVAWRIVSADGHPVEGTYAFRIAGSATGATVAQQAPPPEADSMMGADASGPSIKGAPVFPSLLRGAGLASILALTGLLTFGIGARPVRTSPSRAARVSMWLAVAAPVLLAAHFAMWLLHAAPAHELTGAWLQSAFATTVGRMEAIRVGLALLALWALALTRRPALALLFAGACLIVSGAIGHPAAIVAAIAIPSKAIHLLSIAVWLGGLLWLTVAERNDEASFLREARRVSALALWAVISITITGALQSFLFLGGVSAIWGTAYGGFVLAKIAGLLLLVAFGAYHRQRLIPAIQAGATSGKFRSSIGREMVLLVVVVLIGGIMAYVPTPQPPMAHSVASGRR